MELADAIPDVASAVRRRLGLTPRLLTRKNEYFRQDIITTDPKQVDKYLVKVATALHLHCCSLFIIDF